MIDLEDPRAVEAVEARAWMDLYAAVPPGFAEAAGVGFDEIGGALVIRWAATRRRYFSRTIGLGVAEPATPETIDRILERFAAHDIEMFLLQSLPACRPQAYDGWLHERGLEPFDVHDRVTRNGAPPEPHAGELEVEVVDRGTADEWAAFVDRVYRLDTGDWLPALVGRPGWHHYVARDGGEVVSARSMYIGPAGAAWLGIDGPVPGVMTDAYEPDAAICAFMVEDGLARGATGFVADIEEVSEARDTPAYEYFARLGFERPYARTHYAR